MAALEIVSHDLRGPLANLALLIESVRDANEHAAHDRVAVYTRRAERTLDRMGAILHGMLNRLRRISSSQSLVFEDVDVAGVIEMVASLNRPLARKNRVRLHAYTASPLAMSADADLLLQAVDNLVTNAIRHSPAGGLVLLEAALENEHIVIRVSDEGPGINVAAGSKLFKPYGGLNGEHSQPSQSYGLGLWIVSIIVAQHSGTVAVENNAGSRGAVLTIRLPIDRP
jgi:signal transduction histidine kinase